MADLDPADFLNPAFQEEFITSVIDAAAELPEDHEDFLGHDSNVALEDDQGSDFLELLPTVPDVSDSVMPLECFQKWRIQNL